MKTIKETVAKLKDFNKDLDVKLVKCGSQTSEDWEQETAVEQHHYKTKTNNYVLSIKEELFLLNVEDFVLKSRYQAQEDEWIDETSTIRDERKYSIIPLYIMETEEYKVRELEEAYKINNLTGDDNVPDSIKNLVIELEKMEKKPISSANEMNQREDESEDEYQERMEFFYQSQYDERDYSYEDDNPSRFTVSSIIPQKVNTDFVFDTQINIDNLLDKEEYELSFLKKEHAENFKDPNKLADFNIEDMRKLNDISNMSGNRIGFLNKLNKYSNKEMTEMFHMMKHSQKVIEIFSKDISNYESPKKNNNIKKRRNRLK